MTTVIITRDEFLQDRQGRTFADVANDPEQPFDEAINFFKDQDRQRRMEESEAHHDRAPLAGIVRELESQPNIHKFLGTKHPRRSQRLRQSIGVLVRMIMERRGWRKTGKKGSLGVRSVSAPGTPNHNTGGLAFWFIRAERYEHKQDAPFRSVRERCHELESTAPASRPAAGKQSRNGRSATRPKANRRSTKSDNKPT